MAEDNTLRDLWEYVDFELEVGAGGSRGYSLSVHPPTGGEARAVMHLPFDEQVLENRLQALEIALLSSGTRRRRIRTREEQTVQDFGQKLFETLLTGEVRDCYNASRERARKQNKGLRLKLHIRPPELARLPWEFLYDPDRAEYLCLSHATPIIRSPDLRQPAEPLPVTPPLRILGMVVSPVNLDPLDTEKEKELVEKASEELRAYGRAEFTWLEGQTWRDLQRAMRRGPWHVFHFVGHGGYNPNRDEGLVALANEAGYARFLRAEDLGQLLKGHYPLRLVLLNSCEGARGSSHDAFSSTAATLLRPGIPAVLAMQYAITDEAAIEFSRNFYDAIADGVPLDAAVAEARTALKIELGNTLEWGVPVLHMRSPDGRIFDIHSKGRHTEPTEATEEAEDPWTVEIPDLAGESHDEARNMLHAAGLRLGMVSKTPSDEVAEDGIVEQNPAAGSKVERGTSVRVTVAQRQIEELAVEKAPKRRFYPRPNSLPDEAELRPQTEPRSQRSKESPLQRGRKSEKPQDLPD